MASPVFVGLLKTSRFYLLIVISYKYDNVISLRRQGQKGENNE